MTYAQVLWLDYTEGRKRMADAFECLICGRPEDDFERQVSSMPPEMLREFAKYVAPSSVGESGPQWDDVRIGSLETHAFDFDFEKAQRWKIDRLAKLHHLCRQKLSAASIENA